METRTDAELLAAYATDRSEASFAGLVKRHLALVHSAALRQVGDPGLAEDITQTVFIILAGKAATLGPGTVLSGWLCRTAHLTARNALKLEYRRQKREHLAAQMNIPTDDSWQRLAPLLDAAVAELRENYRNAIVLRFYENRPLDEVGNRLGIGADAAQKRVARAVEKLRANFAKRGVTLSVMVFTAGLSANAVNAAPAGLLERVLASAAKGTLGTIADPGLTSVTLRTLAWQHYRLWIAGGLAISMAILAVLRISPMKYPGSLVLAAARQEPVLAATNDNPSPIPREPLTGTMRFELESPPGGLALQPDGKIIVGSTLYGHFADEQTGILGFYNRGAFRLNTDGSLDRTFRCDVSLPASAAQMARVELLPDGRIFLSGLFGEVNGKSRPNFAILLPDGTPDESFEPWRGTTNPPPPFFLPHVQEPTMWKLTSYQGGITPATLLPDNSVAVACQSLEATNDRDRVLTAYRLDASGQWIQPTNSLLPSGIRRPSGLIDTLGPWGFWPNASIEWTNQAPAVARPPYRFGYEILPDSARPPVGGFPFAQWSPTATHAALVLQALFAEVPLELCRYAVRLPDGGAILAVYDPDASRNGMFAGHLMRFDREWNRDFSFTNNYELSPGRCPIIKRQNDGGILVAGLVGRLNGEVFTGLARLKSDGQTDPDFRCVTSESADGRVMDMVVQADGRIVICGFFSTVNGAPSPYIARLNPDGSLDQTFRTPFLTPEQFQADYREKRRVKITKLAKPSTPSRTGQAAKAIASVAPALPETVLITSMKLKPLGAIIEFTGNPRQKYLLQSKEALNNTDWITLGTNETDAVGAGTFQDADAANHPMRFYRIATP